MFLVEIYNKNYLTDIVLGKFNNNKNIHLINGSDMYHWSSIG